MRTLLLALTLAGCAAAAPYQAPQYPAGYDLNGDPYPITVTEQCACGREPQAADPNYSYSGDPAPEILGGHKPGTGAELPRCKQGCEAPSSDVGQPFSI